MDWQMHRYKKTFQLEGLYSFFYLEHPKNFRFSGERHDFWELVYVDSGEISVVADSAYYTLQQGDLIFHKPMEFHALAANEKDPHNVLVTSFGTDSDTMRFFNNKIFTLDSYQRKLLSRFLDEGRKIFDQYSDSGRRQHPRDDVEAGAYQLCLLHLEHLLIDLLRKGNAPDRRQKQSDSARRNIETAFAESVRRYLGAHVCERLTLQDVCDYFHMGKSHLCQLFKSETGRSVMDYFIELKIAEAKRLIRAGGMNFTQISECLGYASIHHFTRSFKGKTGMSPSVYERSILE